MYNFENDKIDNDKSCRSLTIMEKAINIIRQFCIVKDKYFTLLFSSLIRYVDITCIDLDIKV